jgi:hypothetical protein
MASDAPPRGLAATGVTVAAIALVLLLLVVSPPPAIGSSAARDGPAGASPSVGPSSGGCSGSVAPAQYYGLLENLGGSSPGPSVSGQQVVLSYRVTDDFKATNGSRVVSCISEEAVAFTNDSGTFGLTATLPKSGCDGKFGCWNFTGPYRPLRFWLGNATLPPGDFLSTTLYGTYVTIARVAALDRVLLDPSGWANVSLRAPMALTASPLAADGEASPSNVTFAWSLDGWNWTVLGPSNGSVLTVKPLDGAGTATASLWVNGSYNGTTVELPEAVVNLTAIPTAIGAATVDPTSVDVGTPLTFTITGTGAAGYSYGASVSPGFGQASVEATCTGTNLSGSHLGLTCTANVTYEAVGVAEATATLTNGYSASTWTFAGITIAPVLALLLGPDPLVAYAGAPVVFEGSVVSGTGTGPYGPASLATGDGATLRDSSPATSWSYPYTYTTAGQYEAALTVVDSGGGNDTALLPVTIAPRPSLSTVSLGSDSVVIGTAIEANATVAGGALPLTFWWNLSYPASTVRTGTVTEDGLLALSVLAGALGPATLTLTVVDALGTALSSSAQLLVIADGAASIRTSGSPDGSTVAGEPVELSFIALDHAGERVDAYSGPAVITVNGTGTGTVWVNASATGPVPADANGTFPVAGSAWASGFLNVTVATTGCGTLRLSVASAGGLSDPPPVTVLVGPDEAHLVLLDPQSVHPGARENATVYDIMDRFGNPLPGGFIVVRSVFGTTATNADAPIHRVGAVSFVWVNYSAPGTGAGTVEVYSSSGETLLPPIEVPASPPATGPLDLPLLLLLLLGLALVACVVGAVALHRRRRGAPEPAEPPASDEGAAIEEELKRLAEGRAHVLAHTPADRPADLGEIAAGWTGRPPDLAELSEWVGALVAEGLLEPRVGPDGHPRFVRSEPRARSTPPRVELDPEALDAALSRRCLEEEGAEAGRPE